MLHRRLLRDDGRGVGEALNDTSSSMLHSSDMLLDCLLTIGLV
jgi:hypothetical protein